MVTIRAARFADIPEITRLCRLALEKSHYCPRFGLDKDALKRVALECIGQHSNKPGSGRIVVADNGDQLEALFVGFVRPLYECLSALIASNLIWYAQPGASARSAMGVLDHFTEWADRADYPVLHRYGVSDAITNHNAVGALLTRNRGFRLAGGFYEKGI
ncbi:hypothetical protein [Leisingera sp. M523]|uniref:hypothetical protein n=1 Tax=Leisingera sp. M523 TaxID=2867013 RepID=UPI0021A54697|nr:hypothetical protein [Leisingera sp. M523]UWQ30267.1 hypothetical protein K3557_06940 [Leisingera sp. M523]